LTRVAECGDTQIVQKVATLLALAGLAPGLAPGLVAVAVTAHLASHHDHDENPAQRRAASSLIWHGHAHEDEVPDHDHPLTVAEAHPFPTVRPKVVPLQPHASALDQRSSPPTSGMAERIPVRQLDPVGVGPPVLARTSILRI